MILLLLGRAAGGLLGGFALLLAGGLLWSPPVPRCPGCAVLAFNPSHLRVIGHDVCYPEQVQGGWVC